jgi:copper transport protein
MRRLLIAAGLVAVAVAGWAAPAFGHAVLGSTEPAANAVLSRSPGTIVCHFDEAVEVSFGAVRVFDKDAKRVDSGQAFHPHGDSRAVATNVSGRLPPGGYVVTWRVISDDGHPVHGAFTFRVGGPGTAADAATTQAEAARLLAAGSGSHTVGVLFGVVRFVAFIALALLVGGATFISANWRNGAKDRTVKTLLWGALITASAATIAAIGLQGPYGGGLPLSDATKPAVINSVLRTRFGEVYAARLVILLVAAALLQTLLRQTREPQRLPSWWHPAAVVTGAALLLTPGLAGHAATGSLVALAVPFDLVHLAGVSVWIGGLAVMAVAVLPQSKIRDTTVIARFSQWAFGAVIAIAVSGGFAAWRQIGSISAATSTPYGRLVLYKTIVFAVVLAVASVSRRLVHGRLALPLATKTTTSRKTATPAGVLSPGPGAAANRANQTRPTRSKETRLQRAVFAELGLAALVLVFASILVNVQPAKAALAKPFGAETTAGNEMLVDVVVDPAKAGPVAFHLYTLTAAGAPVDPPAVDASLSLPGPAIDNLPVPLHKAGPGHWIAVGFDVPIRGRWTLTVNVHTGDTTVLPARPLTVPIR